ncbi:MAG TPA: carboxypeptidase-like regulatory domain-containing protein, partial [Bryobacteraceae bacterium]
MELGKLLASRCARLYVVLFAGVLFAYTSFAQNITGTILGTVTDSSGAAVQGASVVIVNQNTNLEYRAVNEGSDYTLTNLPPGTYSVRAELSGFKPSITRDVVLLANRSARVNIVLSPGDVNQTVEVTAAAPTINSENATVG